MKNEINLDSQVESLDNRIQRGGELFSELNILPIARQLVEGRSRLLLPRHLGVHREPSLDKVHSRLGDVDVRDHICARTDSVYLRLCFFICSVYMYTRRTRTIYIDRNESIWPGLFYGPYWDGNDRTLPHRPSETLGPPLRG